VFALSTTFAEWFGREEVRGVSSRHQASIPPDSNKYRAGLALNESSTCAGRAINSVLRGNGIVVGIRWRGVFCQGMLLHRKNTDARSGERGMADPR